MVALHKITALRRIRLTIFTVFFVKKKLLSLLYDDTIAPIATV